MGDVDDDAYPSSNNLLILYLWVLVGFDLENFH